MTYYKVFETVKQAMQASREEAMRRGVNGVTKYWWSWIVHEDGRAALVGVGEDELDESWFPDPELI